MKTEPHTTHTIPHSTTTQKPTPDVDNVVLITGGTSSTRDFNATQHSAEIFRPKFPFKPCILPDLPERYYGHTQDSGMICGGTYTQYTCRKWSSKEGIFPDKPVHNIKPGRFQLVSWTPSSKNETFLMGGGAYNTGARSSSTIVKQGVLNGAPGFKLVTQIYGACSIPWPETDTVLITGGNLNKKKRTKRGDSPNYKRTSVYNKKGIIDEYLGFLNYPRYMHGCTSFVADNKRV